MKLTVRRILGTTCEVKMITDHISTLFPTIQFTWYQIYLNFINAI